MLNHCISKVVHWRKQKSPWRLKLLVHTQTSLHVTFLDKISQTVSRDVALQPLGNLSECVRCLPLPSISVGEMALLTASSYWHFPHRGFLISMFAFTYWHTRGRESGLFFRVNTNLLVDYSFIKTRCHVHMLGKTIRGWFRLCNTNNISNGIKCCMILWGYYL